MYALQELKLKVVDSKYAKPFIERYHYSKSCPNIVAAIGEYYNGKMKNCIVFNYCVGRGMAQQVWSKGDASNTLELARMVSIEPKPKNMESYCIAKALKWLKQNMPNIKIVISYADNAMGHHGYCYQASGFIYYGQSRATIEHYVDGKRVHERTLNNKYGSSSEQHLKSILGDRYVCKTNGKTKSRYYKIVAQNKKEQSQIQSQILVKGLPYPKGDNLKYDMNIKSNFMELDSSKAQQKDTRIVNEQFDIFDLLEGDKT